MKAWEVIFTNQKGEPSSLVLSADQCPSEEDAARAIRSQLFPVMDAVGLNDFQDRSYSPTARWLKEQSGVIITSISEAS